MFDRKSDLVRFLAAADTGNLPVAARELGLTYPALKYTIAVLERRAGAQLFERRPTARPGVRLTPFGAAAARRARRLLREHEDGEKELDAVRAGRQGRLHLAASAVYLQGLLPGALAAFHREYPAVEVALRPAGADAPRLLAEGAIDVYCGVLGAGPLPPGLRREPLPPASAGIVARRDHPLAGRAPSWSDLADQPWIDFCADRAGLGCLLSEIRRRAGRPVQRLIIAGAVGLSLMQAGDYLAQLPLDFLDRLPNRELAALPGDLGQARLHAAIVSRGDDALVAFRRLRQILHQQAG